MPPATFYRRVDSYQRGGPKALADRSSRPDRIWNRIPDLMRAGILDLALPLGKAHSEFGALRGE